MEEMLTILEWVGSRRFHFSRAQFAEGLDFGTRKAIRWLNVLAWKGVIEIDDSTCKGGSLKGRRYRARVRFERGVE